MLLISGKPLNSNIACVRMCVCACVRACVHILVYFNNYFETGALKWIYNGPMSNKLECTRLHSRQMKARTHRLLTIGSVELQVAWLKWNLGCLDETRYSYLLFCRRCGSIVLITVSARYTFRRRARETLTFRRRARYTLTFRRRARETRLTATKRHWINWRGRADDIRRIPDVAFGGVD